MTKRSVFVIAAFSLISLSILSGVANAYWIWTPETKKFTNPKYAVKDSPKEQFDWGMGFYNAKDFQRAATEFDKLAKQYEFSEYASKAQYYVGLCYENMNKYYLAYQNYQKAIDNFPHIANTEEILAREFAIGNLYLSKPGPKVLGTDIMAPLDRAVEIFKKIVENAPYGKFAEESQFKLGEALKKSERYDEAVAAFHKIVEDYPKSKLVTKAMYEESSCAYKASLKPAYDAAATDNAIKTFEKFVYKNKDADLAKNADTTMKRLKDNVAEKSYRAAEFYESQGKTQAATIYYQDVIDTYPDSTFVNKAKARIEAIKNKAIKKAAPPVEQAKKKPAAVAAEKKPWSPFKFLSKEKKPEATSPETPKKGWNPLGFMSNPKEKKAESAAPEVQKKGWNPLGFMSKPKEKKVQPAIQEVQKKKDWNPLGFLSQEKQKKSEAATPERPKKSWNPFSFKAGQKKPETAAAPETPKKNPWNLFNLGANKSPVVKETPARKPWKPLSFDTAKKAQTPKVEAPVAEPPVVEAPKVETSTIEAPVAEVPKVEAAVAETPPAVETPAAAETHVPVAAPVAAPTPIAETPKAEAPVAEIPKAEAPAAETPAVAEAAKKEEPAPQVKEVPKPKAWKPFNFDNKKDPALKETTKSKGWKPLNFGTNDEPMATNRRW